jgi:hypothetical protein
MKGKGKASLHNDPFLKANASTLNQSWLPGLHPQGKADLVLHHHQQPRYAVIAFSQDPVWMLHSIGSSARISALRSSIARTFAGTLHGALPSGKTYNPEHCHCIDASHRCKMFAHFRTARDHLTIQ